MKVYNFSAGPAVLPKEVLQKAKDELLNYNNSGMSVLELSHRSSEFVDIITQAEELLRELMNVPSNYKILFLQGGASTQFSMVPLNLALNKKAYYVVAGSFGKKAYTEAKKLAKQLSLEPVLLASSEDEKYTFIPEFDEKNIDKDAAYVHITTNNTIEGTTHYTVPKTNGVPIVADMSSNILAFDYNIEDFGLIYAGAQKNIGPAGVTLVIVREDLLTDNEVLSSMFDYNILIKNSSLYNTPPTFSIYMAKLVFEWVKSLGGVKEMQNRNEEKAKILYDYIDSSSFYNNPVVNKKERSITNIPFTTKNQDLDKKFIKEAEELGFKNIKGHRSVGGMRASIYNAFDKEGVLELVKFMKKFEQENK